MITNEIKTSGRSRISAGGANQRGRCIIFAENCIKMKNNWAKGNGASLAPPRSATENKRNEIKFGNSLLNGLQWITLERLNRTITLYYRYFIAIKTKLELLNVKLHRGITARIYLQHEEFSVFPQLFWSQK